MIWYLLHQSRQDWSIVCLFIWSLSSHLRIFHLYGDVTIVDEGLQIVTYARQSWPLSSKGSLTCQTCWDTDLHFVMVILEESWHCRAFGSGAVYTYFYDLGLSRHRIEPRSPACEAKTLPLGHRGGIDWLIDCVGFYAIHVFAIHVHVFRPNNGIDN